MKLAIGLDLSLTATGIADTTGRTQTIKTKPKDGDNRLTVIVSTVYDMLKSQDFSANRLFVAIEDLPKHAMAAGITGMVHGAVRVLLIDYGVPYALITPASLKTYATGKGNSPKPELRMSLYKRANLDLADDNQVDAWWLRAMLLDALGAPVLDLPKTHRRALGAVDWSAVR